MKVEDGTADDRLSDVLITYHSATQHCICEPAGDATVCVWELLFLVLLGLLGIM